MNLNKEALLKAKPDLILAHESQKGLLKILDSVANSGVKVVYVKDAQSLDQAYDTFKQIGKVTGREKEADDLVDETKRNVDKVIKSVPRHNKNKVSLWKYLLNLRFIQPVKIHSLMICLKS